MRDIKSLFIAAPISRITTLRDDEVRPCPRFARAASTGAPFRFGFTLIELLVVVLIIGILAAVAVPQYQKAVWKSRAANLQTLLNSVAQAGEIYHLHNGTYPTNFDELDLDIGGTATASSCQNALVPTATRRFNDFEITLYDGGFAQRYLVAAHFITGKYKCTGFVYYFDTNGQSPFLEHHTFCQEGYYDRDCGSNCGYGEFCKKVMNKQHKIYFQLMDLSE